MKITLINEKVKFGTNHEINISAEKFRFMSNGHPKTKDYLIYLNYRNYKIICPILKNKNKEVVIIPAFKLPNSNIPIFVHLYAVAMYLSSEESMRKVCESVKKIFGLETFSHSTLCRTLKKNDVYYGRKP